jgi:hypothetical protein
VGGRERERSEQREQQGTEATWELKRGGPGAA